MNACEMNRGTCLLASQDAPQISILMTAYNAEAFLLEALESVASQQTSQSWELLFVDDGSTDDTRRLAVRFQRQIAGRMRILQHPQRRNLGISASRNLALRCARSPLLTFLDADDVWLPHHLETQSTLLADLPTIAMVYAAAERWVYFDQPFDEAQARAATWGANFLPPLVPANAATGPLPRGRLLDWMLVDESLVPCICTVMMRTSVAKAVGGFCDDFRGLYDDQVFHAKVCASFDVFAHDVCVARYRQHPVSCCAQARMSSLTREQERNRFLRFLQSDQGVQQRTG